VSEYLRSFERYELKYVIHHELAAVLRERITPWVEPDPHNGSLGFYPVVSLYYDSADLRAFWEKLDGLANRRKVRIRTYPGVDPDQAFLEIKERLDRTVRKRRLRAPLDQALGLMAGATSDLSGPVVEEALALKHALDLSPVLTTLYQREAYFGRYEHGLRVTFDRNLRHRPAAPGTPQPFRYDLGRDPFLLPPSQLVLEVKCNDRIPEWLNACLNSLDLRLQRLSKYCHGVDLERFGGRLLQAQP
jgi:SPX domain protein involved in polyphosphate accumulation